MKLNTMNKDELEEFVNKNKKKKKKKKEDRDNSEDREGSRIKEKEKKRVNIFKSKPPWIQENNLTACHFSN